MAEQEKTIRIIGNESNHVVEVEAGENMPATEPNTTAAKAEAAAQLDESLSTPAAERSNDEMATNDGAVIETLDTDFHGKSGVTAGENPSGSNRADYYESRSYGKTDAEEELDSLNNDGQD